MSTKKETTLVKVEGGKNAQEFTQSTIAEMVNPTAQEKPESVEELKTQVLELKKRLLAIPQNLDDRIKYFNEKKDLIRRLAILNANTEALEGHTQKLH